MIIPKYIYTYTYIHIHILTVNTSVKIRLSMCVWALFTQLVSSKCDDNNFKC